MALVEKLSSTELQMMERYIDSYAINTHRTASIEYLLRAWDSAKNDYLYKMLDNHFIISKQVEFHRGVEELSDELENKVSRYGENRRAYRFIEDFFNEVIRPLSKTLDYNSENTDYDLYYAVRGLVDYYSLAENVYHGKTLELPIPDSDKTIKIQNGCRITRVLGRIAKAYNIDTFEDFRVAHSMVLNQKTLKGQMCLSIHPLDYMTMSDNNCDWTSCMSWQDNGCYRQGTVEMMNSSCVVVAYLRSSEDMWMPGNTTWNSKKWRQLFIVTPEIITNVKAYPYANDSLTDIVLNWLKELAEKAEIGQYTKDIYTYSVHRSFTVTEEGWDNFELNVNPTTSNMYNDFSDNQRCFVGKDAQDADYYLRFSYSGSSECMACGQLDPYFSCEEQLVGDCCEEHYTCDCCGDSYYSEDDLYYIDGLMLCEACVNDRCLEDAITGELHYDDNMIEVYLGESDNSGYHQDYSIHVYNDTTYADFFVDYFSKIRLYKGRYGRTYYVNINDCTEDGLNLFGISSEEELHDYAKGSWFYQFPKECEEKEAKSWREFDNYWDLKPNTKIVKKIDKLIF